MRQRNHFDKLFYLYSSCEQIFGEENQCQYKGLFLNKLVTMRANINKFVQ